MYLESSSAERMCCPWWQRHEAAVIKMANTKLNVINEHCDNRLLYNRFPERLECGRS
jgi:hypothetical protein